MTQPETDPTENEPTEDDPMDAGDAARVREDLETANNSAPADEPPGRPASD